MRCIHTFTGKDVRRAGFIEVIGFVATGLLPQEVPQSDGQDGDNGNATNHTTNDCADRSRLRGRDG